MDEFAKFEESHSFLLLLLFFVVVVTIFTIFKKYKKCASHIQHTCLIATMLADKKCCFELSELELLLPPQRNWRRKQVRQVQRIAQS